MENCEIPSELMCPICRTILKNAVQLPCCSTSACRTCALKKLMTSKKSCWVRSTDSCRNVISLDQLTPADDVRRLVEDFKGGGTLYKETEQKNNKSHEKPPIIEDKPVLDSEVIVKQEPVDVSSEVIFSCDSELAAKIAEKSAELRARLAQCKIAGKADVGGEVSETESSQIENLHCNFSKEGIADQIEESLIKETDLLVEKDERNSIEAMIKETDNEKEIITPALQDGHMETSQNNHDFEEEYGESTPVGLNQVGVEGEAEHDESMRTSHCTDGSLSEHIKSSLTENELEEEYGESMQSHDPEEYGENIQQGVSGIKSENIDSSWCQLCNKPGHDPSSCPEVKCKNCGLSGHALFNCPDKFPYSAPNSVESALSGDFSPKKEPGLCTPTSSGYWSDDAREGPYFGKLRWNSDSKTNGFVEIVLDNCETRQVHVSGYDVKCGAENGDLVEFVLGTDAQHGKAAKRVKLVEKGLPPSEADQIKGQYSLKRSLEISAGIFDEPSKKIKCDDIIDVKAEINSLSDYSDIAELDDISADVKAEREYEDMEDEVVYDHCICDKKMEARCQLCPFYFLEAKSSHSLLEGESLTILAKIQGNEGDLKQDLKFVRHLPYPFKFLNQNSFELLKVLGRKCLIYKLSSVFYRDHVFVTLQNPGKKQVTVKPGDILGICQSEITLISEISSHFMFEPPTRQKCHDLPVFAKRGEFSCDENFISCGFGTVGIGDMNYKNCLVRLKLRPELEKKFKIVKDELTVQIKHNIWLEVQSLRGKASFERSIPKDGCIGYASSIMDEDTVKEMVQSLDEEQKLKEQKWKDDHATGDLNNEQVRDSKVDQNAYEEMLSQIDQDMKSNHAKFKKDLKLDDSLKERVFKGTIGENVLIIPSKETIETNLFLQDDDDLNLKPLLKFKAKVSNNEEFKYYNNCYNIDEQIVTVLNGICRTSKTTRPCVKVKISNPRAENTCLKRDSAIALVKIHLDPVDSPKKKPANYMQDISPSNTSKPIEPTSKPVPKNKNFNPVKYVTKINLKYARKWEQFCAENTFQKSLLVEDKYPYFKFKPKIPFGIKDSKDLNIRIGINQDTKPKKVLDKVNGVFTCIICDVVILDRYSLQDHWYASKHKQNMKLVQVIAGLEERLFMNRPIVQEMLEQFKLSPLLGLEHVFEVLQGKEEPLYHCALCNINCSLVDLVPHVTSYNHILAFIKEFFPLAWGRFSSNQDYTTWAESDFDCLNQIVNKIDLIHGRKRPSIVPSIDKLEEYVDKIPINAYNSRRTELDTFFKTLKPVEGSQNPVEQNSSRKKRIITRLGALVQSIELSVGESKSVILKVLGPAKNSLMSGRFIKVSKNIVDTGPIEVVPGISRVWSESNAETFVRVTIVNKLSSSSVMAQKNMELGLISWGQ